MNTYKNITHSGAALVRDEAHIAERRETNNTSSQETGNAVGAHLVLLLCLDAAEDVKQVCEAEHRVPQHARCFARVEHINEIKSEVSLQPQHIAAAAVKDLCVAQQERQQHSDAHTQCCSAGSS